MINSTARGWNPKFDEAYAALKYIVDKHGDSLEFVALDARELVDFNGDPYQVVPVIRISFR